MTTHLFRLWYVWKTLSIVFIVINEITDENIQFTTRIRYTTFYFERASPTFFELSCVPSDAFTRCDQKNTSIAVFHMLRKRSIYEYLMNLLTILMLCGFRDELRNFQWVGLDAICWSLICTFSVFYLGN